MELETGLCKSSLTRSCDRMAWTQGLAGVGKRLGKGMKMFCPFLSSSGLLWCVFFIAVNKHIFLSSKINANKWLRMNHSYLEREPLCGLSLVSCQLWHEGQQETAVGIQRTRAKLCVKKIPNIHFQSTESLKPDCLPIISDRIFE